MDEIKKILNTEYETGGEKKLIPYVEKIIDKKDIFLKSAEKFGTPHYILDERELIKRAKFFINTFKIPNSEFFYAFKCNDLPFIVKTLKDIGYHADVAGIFELELALKLGFKKIIFTSPGKDIDELKLAIENDVTINIDNFDELKRIKMMMSGYDKKVKVSFRLNLTEDVWSKFGFKPEDLKKAINEISNDKIIWEGLHFHCSWNKTPDNYVKNIEAVGNLLRENFSSDLKLKFLDIGGGFYPEGEGLLTGGTAKGEILNQLDDVDFDPTAVFIECPEPLNIFYEKIKESLEKFIFPLNKDIKIFFEPGRFITKSSTRIITKVLSIKNHDEIILDAGSLTLMGDYCLDEYEYAPIVNISKPSIKINESVLYGPLCDPHEKWGFRYHGEKCVVGDKLVILNQGAYTYSFSKRFIKPNAPYIVVKPDGNFFVAKEKENFSGRYHGCKFDNQ